MPPSHILGLSYSPNLPLLGATPLYLLQAASPGPGVGALTWEVKGYGSVAPLRQQLQCAQLLPCVGVKGLSVEQHHLHPVGTRGGEGPAGPAVGTRASRSGVRALRVWRWPTLFLGLSHCPPRL